MTTVTVTPSSVVSSARTDFVKSKFDTLVWEKGYDVIHEKALKCPCVSKETNQQSNCKNCGGTGWLFVNPVTTRMVLHSMNLETKYKVWSELSVGTASVTALAETETSFMDRITVVDGITIFSETLFLKQHSSDYYFASVYNIKEILSLALFTSTSVKLKQLLYGTDFTYSGNKITLLNPSDIIDPLATEQDISVSIRYKHSPQLHIIDSTRDTIETFINIAGAGEESVMLPVHNVAKRAHYVLDRQNFDNTRILNNNFDFVYENLNPPKPLCPC